MRADYLCAHDAASRLGVSLTTLYAYVSRGKIDSRPGPDGRSREYRADDIAHLIERRQAGRGAAQGAAHSLTWGLPVLETRISLIRPHGHYYRGQPAIALAQSGASLEDTARCCGKAATAIRSPRRRRPPGRGSSGRCCASPVSRRWSAPPRPCPCSRSTRRTRIAPMPRTAANAPRVCCAKPPPCSAVSGPTGSRSTG